MRCPQVKVGRPFRRGLHDGGPSVFRRFRGPDGGDRNGSWCRSDWLSITAANATGALLRGRIPEDRKRDLLHKY